MTIIADLRHFSLTFIHFRIGASAPAQLGSVLFSPGGHQYQNYAATDARGPVARPRRDSRDGGPPARMVMAGRVAVGHGGRMAVAAPADMVGSINNSEADGGDGPDLDDHLRGVRAHVAPNIDPRHQRHRYINELRNHAMRQARQAQADFREYRRQEALARGEEYHSDDEEGTCDLRPDFLAMSEPVARAVYPRYDDTMQDIYQVSFLGFNLSADNNRQRSLYTM